MKRFSLLLACFLISLFCRAQQKKVELYDLIRSLLPDSAQASDEVSWANVKNNTFVKWPNAKPKLNSLKKYALATQAEIAIKGKTFPAAEGWDVELEGNAAGYSKLTINPKEMIEASFETTLEYLFGKKPYKYKLFKGCDLPLGAAYEVNIIGKKAVWIYCRIDETSSGNQIVVEGYFLQKDLMKEYCN
ncbi:MAG: hypothetical protein INR73_17425 [Williamsia sp.]|nr:hypothetical protein [Williamsia sp.]